MSVRTAHIFEEKWRSQDVILQEDADFSSLLLSDKVLKGLKKAGYKKPSPIQLQAIPSGRFGQDLVVQAKAGTGKTLVFTIVSLEMLMNVHRPQVLILAPTREIAFQICSVIQAVGSEFEDLKCCSFIGGTPFPEDREKAQSCQIAVGTPGRIHQLITSKFLKTNSIRLFVLDEADQLLDSSFQANVDSIFQTLPKEKQVIATSATYPKKLKKLVHRYFREPFITRLNEKQLTLLGTVHYTYTVQSSQMTLFAYRLKLKALENILSNVKFSQCLIFCNLISRVESLCSDIKKWGFSATYISSAKEQAARLKAIDSLKRFKCKVLVSSDVTSRGIDAENVDLVINFDSPEFSDVYLHRVGRAGRYGSKGVAITFLTEKDVGTFENIEKTGSFRSYILPDPIPENLINIRPDSHLEEDAFPEQDSSSSSEEEESVMVPDIVLECSDSSIQNENIHSNSVEESSLVQNSGLDDNIIPISSSKACQNDHCTNTNLVNSDDIEAEDDIKITNLLAQTIEPNLCQSSHAEPKLQDEKSLSDKVECSESLLSTSRELESPGKSLEPEIRSSSDNDKCQDNLMKECVKKIYVPVFNSISFYREMNKGNDLAMAETLKAYQNPASLNENGKKSLDEKKSIDSDDIMNLNSSLNQYYYSVFNNFKEECINDEILTNLPQDKVLEELDQINGITINKGTKESVEVKSDLPSTESVVNQKSNESKCLNVNQGVSFGNPEEHSNEIKSGMPEEKAESVLESTLITSLDVCGNIYQFEKSSDSSSDVSSSLNFSSTNMLLLHKAWKDAEKDMHMKQTSTRFKELSKKHPILRKTESDNMSDSFDCELDSMTSSESMCSQKLSSTPLSSRSLKSSSLLSTDSSKSFKCFYKPSGNPCKSSSSSSGSSSDSSASSVISEAKYSKELLKPQKSCKYSKLPSKSSTSSGSSSESSASSVISEAKYSKELSKPHKCLKSSSCSSISSGNDHQSKEQLSPNKMQQNRHKSSIKKKSHHTWNNKMPGNSVSGYHYSRNMQGVATSWQEVSNSVHGKNFCACQNMYLCGFHNSNNKHSNCLEPISHQNNLLHTSSYQSQEYNALYATFQRQWEHIYYTTYFQ